MELVHPKTVSLKGNPSLDEFWVQGIIAENPGVLNLGDLVLKDKERLQPKAGRLDLLMQDPVSLRRYEVEVQLGATDESHLIRTVEYWDIERRRFPQYDHCAVIVAEEITSRFLNVISLFNGSIPLIAIQVKALEFAPGKMALIFTTVLDELTLGLEEEDEPVPSDRAYWISQTSAEIVGIADSLLELIQRFAPGYELKYNKYYIGLTQNKRVNNFVSFNPRKKGLIVAMKIKYTDEIQKQLDDAGLEVLAYDKQWNQFRFRLTKRDLESTRDTLATLMQAAYSESE